MTNKLMTMHTVDKKGKGSGYGGLTSTRVPSWSEIDRNRQGGSLQCRDKVIPNTLLKRKKMTTAPPFQPEGA